MAAALCFLLFLTTFAGAHFAPHLAPSGVSLAAAAGKEKVAAVRAAIDNFSIDFFIKNSRKRVKG
ncbi:hypothetical protein [Herminiimonas fonticola]|uniref:hypothetical protein n=1 Tax=Herminiimonas fonticola TaxID=303380 RepID=UPI0013C32810|nr:hypothetical protein [Herminiimonas fonticola]